MNQALERFLHALMQPISRFCIRRGLKLQDIVHVLKAAFIQAALSELRSSGEEISKSRLSIMTGLQRKEITSRLALKNNFLSDKSHPLLTKVIGRWQQSPTYQNEGGEPKPLAYQGENNEFSQLVFSISTDLNPRTVLFELERIGAVTKHDQYLTLNCDVFSPKGDEEGSLQLIADDVADLLAAGEENVFSKPPIPNLHIKTYYDNVCEDSVPEIRKWMLKEGSEFHARARTYLSKFDKDLNPQLYNKRGGIRIAVGMFSITCEELNIDKEKKNHE